MSRHRRPINRTRSRDSRELAAPVATIAVPGSNGNGNAPPADVMRQVSYSGTPSYAGLTRPDDYVAELQEPVRRMQTFEEMRFSDDAVHGALSAREHMIQSSNWMLQPPDDGGGSREILEFVEDNIYPFLDEILGKMSGAIQYGFSAIEPVYGWSDNATVRNYIKGGARQDSRKWGRKIFLQKIANPMQRTIYTFRINQFGDLQSVEQYAWNGFTFLRNVIPPHKLVLFTYNKRGDDFWGIPPTRHAYKAWTFKKQLEALNALGIDRFGAGTPVAEAGPAWTDQDYIKLEQYLKHWRVSDESFLIHPAGGKIDLMSGDGSMTVAILDWVKYYKLCIAMTYLTQGSELGSTDSGSRALGEIMLEQAETVVQGDDEQIANIINQQIVVPLVDWNFGPQDAYPQFIPSQRVRASSAIGTVIVSLITAGALKWEPKDEAWLRDAMHLPSIDLAARQADYDAKQQLLRDAVAAGVNPDAPAPATDPSVVGSIKPKQDPATIERNSQTKQRALALSIGMPGMEGHIGQIGAGIDAEYNKKSNRTPEYHAWESEVLRPLAVSRDLDTQVLRLTGEAHDLLQAIDERLIAQVGKASGIDAMTAAVRTLEVPPTDRAKLRRVMMGAATRARQYGDNAVMMEDARQQGLDPNGVIVAPRVEFAADEKQKDAQVQAAVDAAAEDEAARREAAVRGAVLLAIHMAGTMAAAELLKQAQTAARDNLQNLSVTRLEDNMQQVVNTGFGVGRRDGATRLGDSIKAKVYSAVMDGGTCDACAPYDGAMYPPDYPEDATGVQAPNPKCYGRGRCRCVWMYVTAAELPSAVPASRGADGTGLSSEFVRESERTRSMIERFLDATVRRDREQKPAVIKVDVQPAQVSVRPNITVQMPAEKPRAPLEANLTRDSHGNARVTISTVGGKVLEGSIVKDPATGKKTIKMEPVK
jgi:hypothetical protein